MAQPSVVLLTQGYSVTDTIDHTSTGQRVYVDAKVRPDLTPTTLPSKGTAWGSGVSGLYLTSITKSTLGDDASLGYMYVAAYGPTPTGKDVYSDDGGNHIGVSLSTGAEWSSQTVDPDNGALTLYAQSMGSGSWTKLTTAMPLTRLTPLSNVAVTYRYKSTISTLLEANANLVGKLNNAELWGNGVGTVLFQGTSAVPVKVITDSGTVIEWNVTDNYSIKVIEGITEDTWQYTYYNGTWVRLSTTASDTGLVNTYGYATLPDQVP